MINAEQELYDGIYTACQDLAPTYDYLPMEDYAEMYPFIHVGELNLVGFQTTTSVGGTYTLRVDVWGTKEQRIEVSDLGNQIVMMCQGLFYTENFTFHCFSNEQERRMTTDTSVPSTVYQRCSLTLVFHLY